LLEKQYRKSVIGISSFSVLTNLIPIKDQVILSLAYRILSF